ncbi:rhomboid family intramembrane serine protease [Bacillus tianshenii]|nr:rhomboid family intramembrane serine protease [Bacillus tianshenii]
MLVMEQNLLYWNLVYELVAKHNFHILQIDQAGEVWLESPRNINGAIVRLRRIDLDWANWLSRDVELASQQMKRVKGSQIGRKVKLLNVYVSSYPPVDSYEHVFNESNLTNILIEHENREERIAYIFQKLELTQPDNMSSWYMGDENTVLMIRDSLVRKQESQHRQARQMFTHGKPIITYLLIAINLLMFGLLEFSGGSTNPATLIQYGAKYNPKILEGEWWRLITPMFLHIGFFHLFMNTLALFYLGTAVERIYGSVRFLFIYFIAAVAGGVVSFALQAELSAGASGAIFGCFGALLYFGVVHPNLFFRTMGMNVIFVLGINLVFGFTVPMIDNSAHIGGLVGGFLASAVVSLPNVRKAGRSSLAVVLLSALGVGFVWYGMTNPVGATDPLVTGQTAQQMLQEGDYEQAYEELVHYMEENEDTPAEILFLRSFAEIKLNKYDDAKQHLHQVIEKKSNFHEAYYNLALLYAEENDLAKAKEMAQKAVKLAPDEQKYQELMNQLQSS